MSGSLQGKPGQMISGKATFCLDGNNVASRETQFWNLRIVRAEQVWVSDGGMGDVGQSEGCSNTLSP